MKTYRLVRLMALVCALVAGSRIVADEKSWVGESVMNAKPPKDIEFGDRVNGKQVYFRFSGRFPLTVRDDRDGWVRIHDGNREGWAHKADFVLVRDAPAYFHRKVQANPKDTFALYMRGAGWLHKGEVDNAIRDLNESIRLDATVPDVFNCRGTAWYEKKEHEKAIKDYNEAIRLDPTDAVPFYNRGIVWDDKKEYDKAIKDYDEAIRLDRAFAAAFYNRGLNWGRKKEYDKAIRDYDEVIRLDPKDPDPLNEKAWLLATCPNEKYRDGKKAVELGKRACELSNWKTPSFMGTLAAAHAEVGQFEEALRYQSKALENPEYEKEYGDGARKRIELYKKKTPYRDN
jgi:tetratricopeptide (TPR) repeat protein